MIDMEKQMSIIKKLQPNIQTIGFFGPAWGSQIQ